MHGGYGVRAATALPTGYGPADLHSAYNLPTTGGAARRSASWTPATTRTPRRTSRVYRSTYGLPPCTTANGCFRKVNQEGAASPLPQDRGWGIEIALDLEMVSAACPDCHIVLVEGDSPSFAVAGDGREHRGRPWARTRCPTATAAPSSTASAPTQPDYTHPGVAIVASSGDAGYGVPNMPAVFPSVVAVGGTSLTRANNARGWTESAWVGASSGCSAWVDKPAWQTDANCPGRMVADVAADADPAHRPAVYDSYDGGGWLTVGGTSAASPFIAGVIGLAGNPGRYPDASYFYSPRGVAERRGRRQQHHRHRLRRRLPVRRRARLRRADRDRHAERAGRLLIVSGF